jgi:hypothetical protein
MKRLAEQKVDGYVPDRNFRSRNEAFDTAQRHRSRKALPGRSVKHDVGLFQ